MFCRMYCDTPSEEVSKCDRIKPQLIRLSKGVTRSYKFKLYYTCNEEITVTTGSYSIITGDTTVIKTGTFTITDDLFEIPIKVDDSGYYRLIVYCYEGSILVCSCMFPIDVC